MRNNIMNLNYFKACEHIANELQLRTYLSSKDISKIIRSHSAKFHLSTVPKNEDILLYLSQNNPYKDFLLVKPSKTASGIAVIPVMPKPYECPHGKCIYCPGGIDYNTPMSYVGTEPVTRIAQSVNFDPYLQVKSKLEQLCRRGHNTSKIELVVVGGTFPFMPELYQKNFAKSCYDALNDSRSVTLEESIKTNETAKNRCVGFTVETKPDYCKKKHVDLMLEMGVTKVEIGIQVIDDHIYRLVNRGHTLLDVKESFKISRDAGYKIVAHMMPGLPGSNVQKDLESFQMLFENPSFKPDMLKIYPTLVLKHTGLYELYKKGKYNAYSEDEFIKIILEVKKIVPSWVRIMRIQREIETIDIMDGNKKGNIRQIILKKLKDNHISCRCIRCREPKLKQNMLRSIDDTTLKRIDYSASGGKEIFLSIETIDNKILFGFIRLRIIANSPSIRKELKDEHESAREIAVVRELHVYGKLIGVGDKNNTAYYQHKGLGLKLIKEAERIAKEEFHIKKISVISAVGTRKYYNKIGYIQNGPYVTKLL
ncbi:MAG: tRNA uridine(34) 5-carboxymethylaminomethyl modification radical SAM/GNAT enzyme Elp3 [Nitrososphaeraceae archaeon]